MTGTVIGRTQFENVPVMIISINMIVQVPGRRRTEGGPGTTPASLEAMQGELMNDTDLIDGREMIIRKRSTVGSIKASMSHSVTDFEIPAGKEKEKGAFGIHIVFLPGRGENPVREPEVVRPRIEGTVGVLLRFIGHHPFYESYTCLLTQMKVNLRRSLLQFPVSYV